MEVSYTHLCSKCGWEEEGETEIEIEDFTNDLD